jgi:hypothetical protein
MKLSNILAALWLLYLIYESGVGKAGFFTHLELGCGLSRVASDGFGFRALLLSMFNSLDYVFSLFSAYLEFFLSKLSAIVLSRDFVPRDLGFLALRKQRVHTERVSHDSLFEAQTHASNHFSI